MGRQSSNEQQHGTQKTKHAHLLFNPEPFLCLCGKTPAIEKSRHPDSGKGGYFVVQCCCGNHSIYAKERYKAILDWNIKPISQDTGCLVCPGLHLEDLNVHDALEVATEEFSRLKMVIADRGGPIWTQTNGMH